ncbi:PIN domain-containing protein [Candidatus Pacearchaeota archaeon]|nr:PIN domain-containing protein [Candidatus Pacearchaeota archaeon]
MNYKYVIDTYAWVEYFKGSEEGKVAKPYIEEGENTTSVFTIAELSEKYKRENKKFEEDCKFVLSKTKIIEVSVDIAKLAGELNAENKKKIKNWGMADAIILATANMLKARVITGDEHFKTLNALMINAQ